MIPDPTKRRVQLAIKWVNGDWLLEDGSPLPEVKNESEARLSIEVGCLLNRDDRERLTREHRVKLLESDTPIFARVNYNNVPASLVKDTIVLPHKGRGEVRFVQVNLVGSLFLSVSVGRKAGLSPCYCVVPALGESAESVNEAYKKIATEFEPDRRSNVGNVFSLMYVESEGDFIKLDELRQKKLEEFAMYEHAEYAE